MTRTKDLNIINNMIKYGGGFVKRLGEAAMYADDNNLERLKKAFPEYWNKYGDIKEVKIDN